MRIVILAAVVLVLIFGLVVFFGAPYLPTLKPQTSLALDMLKLKSGQTLLELGSGDGRILAAAAERGIYTIGIELNLLLVIYTKLRYWKYRKFISVRWGNFWLKPLPECDGIYTFLHTRFMQKLDNKIIQDLQKPVKLVSFGFELPNRKPVQEKSGLFLYKY